MNHTSANPRSDLVQSALAGFVYFAIVFAAGFVLGTVRVLVLIPHLGETAAVLLEMPIILGVAWFACGRLIAAFGVPTTLTPRMVMGAMAFLLLMGAELGLSVLLLDETFVEHLAQYRETHAWLGLAGQIAFGAFPVLQFTKPAHQ